MKHALIELPDDFGKGVCHDCPLYADDCCVLHYRYDECPLELDVPDKIRAEIEQITDTMGVSYNQYVSKIDVLRVIDKYVVESDE